MSKLLAVFRAHTRFQVPDVTWLPGTVPVLVLTCGASMTVARLVEDASPKGLRCEAVGEPRPAAHAFSLELKAGERTVLVAK